MDISLSVAEHAKKYNIHPNKTLGQNFILDINFCSKLIKHESIEGANVIEIGPGIGGMTRAILARNPKKLICIEKDKRCIGILKDLQKKYNQLEFIEGDALLCLSKAIESLENVIIVSNLPYNVGTRIVINILELQLKFKNITSMTFMLQKEVVDRMISDYNKKTYSQLSILIQSICNAKLIMNVSPKNFYPEPKVSSAIIHLRPKHELNFNIEFFNMLKQVLFAAFSKRRKIIKTSLAKYLKYVPESMHLLRPEQIRQKDYINIIANIFLLN
ncbi:MAG: 16S rRNA (adenine(1518)-N(6)/adenine(1519)-N(6))-dimethyltransferase RsmA [Rickettsiales bacterium]